MLDTVYDMLYNILHDMPYYYTIRKWETTIKYVTLSDNAVTISY